MNRETTRWAFLAFGAIMLASGGAFYDANSMGLANALIIPGVALFVVGLAFSVIDHYGSEN